MNLLYIGTKRFTSLIGGIRVTWFYGGGIRFRIMLCWRSHSRAIVSCKIRFQSEWKRRRFKIAEHARVFAVFSSGFQKVWAIGALADEAVDSVFARGIEMAIQEDSIEDSLVMEGCPKGRNVFMRFLRWWVPNDGRWGLMMALWM